MCLFSWQRLMSRSNESKMRAHAFGDNDIYTDYLYSISMQLSRNEKIKNKLRRNKMNQKEAHFIAYCIKRNETVENRHTIE